tara:strand:+ start:220 stop:438 length:219 start_codon:yes stop_codon:yes gene_type:complete
MSKCIHRCFLELPIANGAKKARGRLNLSNNRSVFLARKSKSIGMISRMLRAISSNDQCIGFVGCAAQANFIQ